MGAAVGVIAAVVAIGALFASQSRRPSPPPPPPPPPAPPPPAPAPPPPAPAPVAAVPEPPKVEPDVPAVDAAAAEQNKLNEIQRQNDQATKRRIRVNRTTGVSSLEDTSTVGIKTLLGS